MPRDRQLVMGKVTPQESYEVGLKKSIKLYRPFEVVAGDLVGIEEAYAVVYTAPRGDDREVVSRHNDHAIAVKLRKRLSRAWAQGFRASGKVE